MTDLKFKNEAHIGGTLAADPTIRYTTSGKEVANFTVATKFKTFTEFHRIVAWEALAQKVEKLTKGDFVKVVGRLQTRSWEDKQTSQKKYLTEIVAFQVSTDDEPTEPNPSGGTAIAKAILSPAKTNVHGMEVSDHDIPF
jgi:single-strand DNA-binding protein